MTDHPSIQQMLDSLKYLWEETTLLDEEDEKHLRVVSSWIDLLLDDTDYREMLNQPEFRDKPDDYGVLVEFLPDLPGIGEGSKYIIEISHQGADDITITISDDCKYDACKITQKNLYQLARMALVILLQAENLKTRERNKNERPGK
jgi:hypothetical protein